MAPRYITDLYLGRPEFEFTHSRNDIEFLKLCTKDGNRCDGFIILGGSS